MTTRATIERHLTQSGWERDRAGCYRKIMKDKVFRYKFQQRVVRLEFQMKHPRTEINRAYTSWHRVRSWYYGETDILKTLVK